MTMADDSFDAALRTARAVLDAYECGILPINARYLADTLRMVLDCADKRSAGDADAEMLRRYGVERCTICGVALRSHAGGDHPWTGEEPLSDEDRIRDAMTEAMSHGYLGRVVTR